MKLLFCSDDFDHRSVDQHFIREEQAARSADIDTDLVDFSAIRRGDEHEAFRHLRSTPVTEPVIYRGWMLTPEEYQFFDSGLRQRNFALMTTPSQYLHCHWLPNSYSAIREFTPHTVWVPIPDCFDEASILTAAQLFRGSPLIVKDYVKSRKHEWSEACYIPDSSDIATVRRVTKRFLELQEDELQGGLVLREFVELEPIGTHPKSRMPLTLEYRLFVFNQQIVSVSPYWDADYISDPPPVDTFLSVLTNVQSPFFSCDIARRTTGEWIIVELGDGQVAGVPERCKVESFYRRLSCLIAEQSFKP